MKRKIILYTAQYCPHCQRAKRLLERKGLVYEEIDVTNDPLTRQKIEEKTGWMTVPMIFIGEEFIGGADELYSLELTGELDKKLTST